MGQRGGVVSKEIYVHDEKLIRAVEEGAEYLVIGQRRFLLVEMDDTADTEPYRVTDPEEISMLRRALQNSEPLLTGDEALDYVQSQLKKHGAR